MAAANNESKTSPFRVATRVDIRFPSSDNDKLASPHSSGNINQGWKSDRSAQKSRRRQDVVGRESRAQAAAGQRGPVQIPKRRLSRARIVEREIQLAVAVEISCVLERPTRWQNRSVGAARDRDAVQIPERCLASAGVND